MTGTCEICEREKMKLTKHHLIPRCRHKTKRNKKTFDREDVRTRLLWICRTCHNQIHVLLTEKELETDYNTKEALLAHPEVAKFAAWIRKRKFSGRVPVKGKADRRRN